MHSAAALAGQCVTCDVQFGSHAANTDISQSIHIAPPTMSSKVKLLDAAVLEARRASQHLRALQKSAKRTYDHLETHSAFACMHGAWRHTLMMVYVLSNDLDLALDYCTYTRSNWRGENYTGWVDFDEMATFLRNNKSVDPKWTTWAHREHCDQPAHFDAAVWLAEHRTYIDLLKLNVKGITPPAHVIIEMLHINFTSSSCGQRAADLFRKLDVSSDFRKYYMAKFRRKWSVGFLVLPQRPPLAASDIVHKD